MVILIIPVRGDIKSKFVKSRVSRLALALNRALKVHMQSLEVNSGSFLRLRYCIQ